MVKLKILKGIVFLMTFCMAFLICLAIAHVASREKRPGAFLLNLHQAQDAKINSVFANGDKLFVVSGQNTISVINMQENSLEGTIILNDGENNGEKK